MRTTPKAVKKEDAPKTYNHRAQPGVTQAAANEITVSPFAVTVLDDEPRVRDLDLAERLGFDRPRDIRKLIERHKAEIDSYGVCATVAQTSGPRGGRPTTEFYLNEEQSLMLATVSNAPAAPLVRRALIKTFVALRRGQVTVIDHDEELAALRSDVTAIKETLSRVSGMEKMNLHKVTGIEGDVREVKALAGREPDIKAMVDEAVARKLAEDPRRAVIDKVSIRELLEEAKVPSKGRRSLQRKVFNRLMAFCVQNKIDAYQCALSRTWLFDRPKATWFFRENCAGIVSDHLAKLNGQGVLRLVVPKRGGIITNDTPGRELGA